jgi:hypothetical protein
VRNVFENIKKQNKDFLDLIYMAELFGDDEAFLTNKDKGVSASDFLIKLVKFLGYDISHNIEKFTIKKHGKYFHIPLKSSKKKVMSQKGIIQVNYMVAFIWDHFLNRFNNNGTEIALREYKETNISVFDIDFHNIKPEPHQISAILAYFYELTDNKKPLLLLRSTSRRGLHIYCLTNSFKDTKYNFELEIRKKLKAYSNIITSIELRHRTNFRPPFTRDYEFYNPYNNEKREGLLETFNRVRDVILEENQDYLYEIDSYKPKTLGYTDMYLKRSNLNFKDHNFLNIGRGERHSKIYDLCFSVIRSNGSYEEFTYACFEANKGSEDLSNWIGHSNYNLSNEGEKALSKIWKWCNEKYNPLIIPTVNLTTQNELIYDFSKINLEEVKSVIEENYTDKKEIKNYDYYTKALALILSIYLNDKIKPKRINPNIKEDKYNIGVQIPRSVQNEFQKHFNLKGDYTRKFNVILNNKNLFTQYKPNELGWVYNKNHKGVCRQYIPKDNIIKRCILN